MSYAICGVMYQFIDKMAILRAVTASGGDVVEYFIDEDDQSEQGSLN